MITTENVGGVARRGRLGRIARETAKRRGRRDGARGIPRLPASTPQAPGQGPQGQGQGQGQGEPHNADLDLITPYVMEIWTTTRRATEQMRSALIRREHTLITRIREESVRVVTQYDVRQDPTPAALARFGGSVGRWRTSIDLCRSRAQAVTDRGNQQLAFYWDELRKTHPRLAASGLLPPPARGLPGQLELDRSWDRADVWLLTDDEQYRTATSRALQILERQNVRRPDARSA